MYKGPEIQSIKLEIKLKLLPLEFVILNSQDSPGSCPGVQLPAQLDGVKFEADGFVSAVYTIEHNKNLQEAIKCQQHLAKIMPVAQQMVQNGLIIDIAKKFQEQLSKAPS